MRKRQIWPTSGNTARPRALLVFIALLLLGATNLATGASHADTSTTTARLPVPDDILSVMNVGEPAISPDGQTVAYTITSVDRQKNGYTASIWLVASTGGSPVQLTGTGHMDSLPRWSPDGKSIAFSSDREGGQSLWVADVASRQLRMIAPWPTTNRFLSKAGNPLSWAPDSRHIAFVASQEGADLPQTDPRVITRIQYKTRTSFSDDRNVHIFVASLDGAPVQQITKGDHDEHSISWSPRGDEIAFVSNHEPDPDARLSYEIYAVNVATGVIRQLTHTQGVEYSPVWSPDGAYIAYVATTRPLTTIDSVAEDMKIWVIGRDGGVGHIVTGALDRRCFGPEWSPDSRNIYFAVKDQGRILIFQVARGGGNPTVAVNGDFQSVSFSVGRGQIAYTRGGAIKPDEIWLARLNGKSQTMLTTVNEGIVKRLKLSQPQTLHFNSFDGSEIEGWLIRPTEFEPGKKYPMILSIHGGPHEMEGYSLDMSLQILAANGYAVLDINPRGSAGYGQKFSDGGVMNWGGGDYEDLMKGVDYALAQNAWIDPSRLGVIGGSYGGFMANWVITQTQRFKVAVVIAGLSDLASFYATSIYQDLIHTEFNGFPWDNWELLWKYSPIHYIKNATTPTMFIHGEWDNDVPITQAEEMYMGLKRRGIESVLLRYPREGHGNKEPDHRLDQEHRILAWFGKFLK